MKRITLISGPIGSGKSTFAINYTLKIAQEKDNVKFLDLDYLNVYFRSRTMKKLFEENNIEMIGSSLNYNHQADLPAISGAVYTPFSTKSMTAVYDLAGDISGLNIIKSVKDRIKDESEVDLFLVLNKYRLEGDDPFTQMCVFIDRVEKHLGLKVTGLVSNGHLMQYTTEEEVKSNLEVVKEVSKKMNIPIKYYVAYDGFEEKDIESIELKIKPTS